MSNLYDSDVPEEVLGWLHEQEEVFAIFKRWYGTERVAGGELSAKVWQYFKIGELKAYLNHIGYAVPMSRGRGVGWSVRLIVAELFNSATLLNHELGGPNLRYRKGDYHANKFDAYCDKTDQANRDNF